MTARSQRVLLGLVLVATIAGFVLLYRLRLGQGDFFPPYSSLRSDPLGTRVLHDSLETLPGWRVTRWRQEIAALAPTPARTIVLAGFPAREWKHLTPEEFAALDAAVRNGSRLVIALHAARFDEDLEEKTPRKPSAGDNEKPAKKKPPASSSGKPVPTLRDRDAGSNVRPEQEPVFANLAKLWGIELKQHALFGRARRLPTSPDAVPPDLRWESDLAFAPVQGMGWQTIYRRALEPVLVELSLGRGSIVLAGDSYFLSNEALQRDRSSTLLAWTLGAQSRVEFVESHLGLVDDPGIAALARRYRLGGAFFALVVLAALFVWRRMALFVPPTDEADGVTLNYNQTAGLEALLRRAVPPSELVATCAEEWRRSSRPSDQKRVETALASVPKNAAPASAYNTVVRALRRR